ncbi:transketolase [Lachnospiraceae bacterium]|nr:transketolase [Lachnospiraceae bacterium]
MLEISRKNARIWSMLGMRRVVGIMLEELAGSDEHFIFATADLGRYLGAADFEDKYPGQMIDVGIAEQNLIGVSAGMQQEGFHVFAGTYATFVTARALDQIRVNLGYMNLGVKLIGAAGGLSDGNFSPTHMALEDIADIRPIPGIAIISPADGAEVVKAMYALAEYEGPAYLRLTGRANTPVIYTEDYDFKIGKAVCLKEGTEIAFVASGTIVATVQKAAAELEKKGISCKVINMHTIKPLDTQALDELEEFKLLVTVEEHMAAGGMGSAVAEYMGAKAKRPVQQIIAAGHEYPHAGEYEILLETCGLTVDGIVKKVEGRYRELQNGR